MSDVDVFPLSTSAYIADTTHLSCQQHGAYILIMMAMWRSKGWIADDDKKLANICRLSIAKWRKIAPEVRALLITNDGRISQKRLKSEFENESKRVSQNRKNGSAGGLAKALKNKEPTVATASNSPAFRQSGGDDALLLLGGSVDSQVKQKKEGRGTALPGDWHPSDAEIEYGVVLGMTRTEVLQAGEAMRLWADANRNRQIGRKANWSSTFKGWLLRNSQRGSGGTPPRRGGNAFARMALQGTLEEIDERAGLR